MLLCLYGTNVVASCFVIKLSYRLLVRERTYCWPFITINFTSRKIFAATCTICVHLKGVNTRLKNSQKKMSSLTFLNQYSPRFSFPVLTNTWREHQLFLSCAATENSGCNCHKCTHILFDCITLLEFVLCHKLWLSSSCYSNSRVNKMVTHKCSWFKSECRQDRVNSGDVKSTKLF